MENKNYDGILWFQLKSGYWRSTYGYQHIYVYEKLTGNKVFDWQVVHHMDRDKENNTANNLVCMSETDHGYFHGVTQSEEKRNRISKSMMGKQNSLGMIASEETRNKMSMSRIGKSMSTEAVVNMSYSKISAPLRSDSTTGYRGVCWSKQKLKYTAQIFENKKLKYLGSYESPEEAARVYDAKAKELWGDIAYQNLSV
jgi:hypothetical protein